MNVDKIDKSVMDTAQYLAPYALPHVMKPIMILAGFGIWYGIESIPKVDKYTIEDWNKLTHEERDSYLEVKTYGNKVVATKTYIPPILHEAVYITRSLFDTLMLVVDEIWGIGKKTGFVAFAKDKPLQAIFGTTPGAGIPYWIWRWRKRREQEDES